MVQLANTAPQPFRVNLLDASTTKDIGTGPRAQIVFADAALDRLPQEIRVRINETSAVGGEPWVWVNTEDLDITTFSDSLFAVTDPAGTRPQLTGVLRVGDAATLATKAAAASRPTALRNSSTDGIDLFGYFDMTTKLFGLDVSASLEIPRHIAVWEPESGNCSETTEPVGKGFCPVRPHFEPDDQTNVGLKFKTTATALGDLKVDGTLVADGTKPDGSVLDDAINFHLKGAVGQVPGQFDVFVSILENRRIASMSKSGEQTGSTTFKTSFDANAALGSVLIEVVDNNYDADPDDDDDGVLDADDTDPSAKQHVFYQKGTNASDMQETSNYAVSLTGVPADLDITGRIQLPESRLGDGPGPPPADPCSPTTEEEVGGIGFLHVQLDLGSPASGSSTLNVDARDLDGQYGAKLNSSSSVSGFVNGRLPSACAQGWFELRSADRVRALRGDCDRYRPRGGRRPHRLRVRPDRRGGRGRDRTHPRVHLRPVR